MLKYILVAALVSVVSGCVTSNPGTFYSESAPHSVKAKQTAETTYPTAKPANSPIVLGAAY